jgi:hypothetical protein
MPRMIFLFLVVWLPLFLLFMNHRRWKWSVAKSAGAALLFAGAAGAVTAAILAAIVVQFD